MSRYLVAGSRPWSREVFDAVIRTYPGVWRFAAGPEQLTLPKLRRFKPDAIFFLHWSWKVPSEIVSHFVCIGFHMTDLPYGRGGSPLQHLILRGHRRTKLSAFRLTSAFDAGPIYAKQDLSLAGSAQDIYERASRLAARMIRHLIRRPLAPKPQQGTPVVFARRRPEDSQVPSLRSLERLKDFIRMLDADGYPRAFVEAEGFRFEFSRASRKNGALRANVTITPVKSAA